MKTRNDLTDLAHRLILRAARKAPRALAERLEEEWLADLQSRSGSLSRLRLAVGCCWATGVITRDFRVPQLATSGAPSGHRLHLGELQHSLPLLSRRTFTFLLIAGLHVLLIYFFASGLAQKVVTSIPSVIQLSFAEEARPHQQLPPAVPRDFKPAQIHIEDVPPPDSHKISYPTDDDTAKQTGDPTPPGAGTPEPTLPPAVQRVVGGPGKGFPNTDDFYPATSRRMAETGAATVHVCVDIRGRLTADPTLTRSSGSRRIDDGALNLAKAGSGHYRPSTEDGQPVSACYPYRIRFELN
jgi:TonB family protein